MVGLITVTASSVVDWLDTHQGTVTAVVGVAAFVALLIAARQLRLQREAQEGNLRPALVARTVKSDAERMVVELKNVGPGPALDVQLRPGRRTGRAPAGAAHIPAIAAGEAETIELPLRGGEASVEENLALYHLLYTGMDDKGVYYQRWHMTRGCDVVTGEPVEAFDLEVEPQEFISRLILRIRARRRNHIIEPSSANFGARHAARYDARRTPSTLLWRGDTYDGSTEFIRRLRHEEVEASGGDPDRELSEFVPPAERQ